MKRFLLNFGLDVILFGVVGGLMTQHRDVAELAAGMIFLFWLVVGIPLRIEAGKRP